MSLMSRLKAGTSTAITTRLVLFYLISTLAILFCTNWFQFRTLADDLQYEDNDFLVERISSLRSLIARHVDTSAALRDQIQQTTAGQHTRYLVRVQDASGRTVIESPDMATVPSIAFPPPIHSDSKIGRGTKYVARDGNHYILNAAWAEEPGNPNYLVLQVALDVTDEIELMGKYRLKMGISLLIGLLLAALLAIVITRKGLQPLHTMATAVAQITETDLHQRIRIGTWPKELDQLTIALDGMLARLEESFARLSEFSANLAHELRTPLNNLRGEAEVALSRPRSNEEYRQIIESSMEEYERLTRMVGDILFLARPDQDFAVTEIDARAEIEKLVEYYRNMADEQLITITIEGAGTVSADPRLFQRALGNVISNALHYTGVGGRITVSISNAQDRMTVAVRDTGMGISAMDLPRVFDRFYRSSQARLQYGQGSGLGLAIVRSIMTLHGGTVTVISEPEQGTVVYLQFMKSVIAP